MKPLKFSLLNLLLVANLALASSNVGAKTLLVFGDSLSAAYGISEDSGWVNLLQQKIIDSNYAVEVVNASVSGETSTGGLARLPAILQAHSPDLVILELGGNDGLRGLPVTLLKQNLQTMIDLIEQAGASIVFTGIQIPPNYGPRYTEPFFEIYSDLAEENGLALVPFLIDGIPQRPELMQNDGIHPKAEAQGIILDNVWGVLETELDEIAN